MLLCQAKKSAKAALLNAWNRQQNWQKVGYHFGEKPVFGYQKDKKFADPNLVSLANVEAITEKQLTDEFRTVGHFLANINPLESGKQLADQLQKWPEQTSLLKAYLENKNKLQQDADSVERLISRLAGVYCGDVGIEFMHIPNVIEREWVARHWEELSNGFQVNDSLKQRIAEVMIKCETFDEFMALKFPSVKRYGAEGSSKLKF